MLGFGYYNMDCMVGLNEFPDNFFDIAVCDPPYGLKEHGGKKRSGYVKQKNGSKLYVKDGGYENRGWDNKPVSPECIKEIIRVSKNQIIFGVNYFECPLPGGRIIWDKCNDGSDQSDAEIAYCSFNNRVDIFRFMWRGMMQGKSAAEGTIQQGNKALNEKRIHPAQKPIALYEWILGKYVTPEMKLLDSHVGSASSLIAAYRAGIDFVGFEIDTAMYELSMERYKQETAQISLFDLGMERTQ